MLRSLGNLLYNLEEDGAHDGYVMEKTHEILRDPHEASPLLQILVTLYILKLRLQLNNPL